MSKWGKIVVITAGLLILFLVGGVLAIVYKFARPGVSVPRQIAAIRAKGLPTTLAEIQPHKIPDAENGALIYASIFKIMQSQNVLGTEFDSIDNVAMPDEPKTPQLWSQSRKVVEKYSKALALVDDAVARPKCIFSYNLSFDAHLDDQHLQNLRKLSRIVAAKAVLDARDGKMEQAAYWVNMQFKISESLQDESSLISCLCRIALVKKASQTLSEIRRYGSLSDNSAKQLLDTLASMDLYSGFKASLIGERVMVINLYESLGTPRFASVGNKPVNKGSSPLPAGGSPIVKLALGKDMHRYLDTAEKQISVSTNSYREIMRDHPTFLEKHEGFLGFSAIDKVFAVRDEAVVHVAGSRISLALDIYKKKFGQYPQALSELRAVDFHSPKDLFSGKGFIYKRQGAGYLLYSIGSNLRDDGGKPRIIKHGIKALTKNDKWPLPVDIVWRSER